METTSLKLELLPMGEDAPADAAAKPAAPAPEMHLDMPALKRIALALAVVILAVMAWQGLIAARDTVAFNDVTADLGLPRILHWIALLVGVIGAGVAALAMAWRGNGRP